MNSTTGLYHGFRRLAIVLFSAGIMVLTVTGNSWAVPPQECWVTELLEGSGPVGKHHDEPQPNFFAKGERGKAVLAVYTPGAPPIHLTGHTVGETDWRSLLDTDCDGLSDSLESNGFLMADGSRFPECDPNGPHVDCVDPNERDFFLAVEPLTGNSLFPTNLNELSVLANQLVQDGSGGLQGRTHVIDISKIDGDRQISPEFSHQKAALIKESDQILEPFGKSDATGLNGFGVGIVYTHRIQQFVLDEYNNNDITIPSTVEDIIAEFILHTTSHEYGHLLGLTAEYNARFGGQHYSVRAGVVMSMDIVARVRGAQDVIEWTIGTIFPDPDPQDACPFVLENFICQYPEFTGPI